MTVEELHDEVQLGLQKMSSYAVENFQDQEVDKYLNFAQLEIIKDRYRGLEEAGFEDSANRVSDLQPLVNTSILLPTIDATTILLGSAGEYLIPLPADYMYFVMADSYTGNLIQSRVSPYFCG